MIADGAGHAIAFRIAPGQAHELPHAIPLLAHLPGVPRWIVADRGYTSHRFREHVWGMGAQPAIPPQRHEAPVACPDWIYNNRNRVERLWARLKEWRAVATRYEKTAASFTGVLCLAATLVRLKRLQALTDEDALNRAIIALASEYGRYGYRRVTAWRQGGKDRVQRIWGCKCRPRSATRVRNSCRNSPGCAS